MNSFKLLAVSVTLSALSCSGPASKPDIGPWVKSIASLECRAIQLREQRFNIANKIRFAQDTMMQQQLKSDTVLYSNQIARFNEEKTIVLNKSLVLADSIKYLLDSMRSKYNNDTSITRILNQSLKDTLLKRGCLE